LTFIGSALMVRSCPVIQFPLLGYCLAAGYAIGVFGEFFLRQGSGNTTIAEVLYRDPVFFVTTPDGQVIPFFQAAAGFDPLAVDLDFATFDGFTGQGAGFEEPRRP
jgi:hypothetical protein